VLNYLNIHLELLHHCALQAVRDLEHPEFGIGCKKHFHISQIWINEQMDFYSGVLKVTLCIVYIGKSTEFLKIGLKFICFSDIQGVGSGEEIHHN
jgi:hypothetical protein